MTDKEREVTDHCAVSADLNDRQAHLVFSVVGTNALASFLEAGTLEAEAAGLAFRAVELPSADLIGSKTNYD